MKKKALGFLIALYALLTLCSCASVVLPYREEPLCRKGASGGYCGSLSDVYDTTSNDVVQDGELAKRNHNKCKTCKTK